MKPLILGHCDRKKVEKNKDFKNKIDTSKKEVRAKFEMLIMQRK